jgi:putative FmdB family regulatory protein
MSPVYEYQCQDCAHVSEELRPMYARNRGGICSQCGQLATLVMSRSHVVPDGVYSYAPNVGDPVAFEKRLGAMKEGQAIIQKEPPNPEGSR